MSLEKLRAYIIMENVPFLSPDDDEEKSSFSFESDDDDEDKNSLRKSKKSSKTRRSVFFGGEKTKNSADDSKDEKKSIFGPGKEGIFSGLVKKTGESDSTDKTDIEDKKESDEEKDAEEFVGTEEGSETQITNEFKEVVDEKLQDTASAAESAPEEQIDELDASSSFLASVGKKITEGLPPENAIEDARQESVENTDPASQDDNHESELASVSPPEVQENIFVPPEETEPEEEEFVGFTSPTTQSTPPPKKPIVPPPIIPPTNHNVIPPTLTPVNNLPGSVGSGPAPNLPNFNTQPNPNMTPDNPDVRRMNSLYYRDGRRGGLLLGGALGYLFGRRRGRIKTEKRLEPEITKKSAEVDKLKGDLERSEEQVRAGVAENSKQTTENITAQSLEERVQQQREREEKFADSLINETPPPAKTEQQPTPAPINAENNAEQISRIETPATALARIAQQEQEKPITKEAELSAQAEVSPDKKRDVKTMSTTELLEIADDIHLEHVSLRQLYENRKIDAVNLRRVILEYASGGNYEKLLRKSLETVELKQDLSRELDPSHKTFSASPELSVQARSSVATPEASENNKSDFTGSLDDTQRGKHTFSDGSPLRTNGTKPKRQFSNVQAVFYGTLAGIIIMIIVMVSSNSI